MNTPDPSYLLSNWPIAAPFTLVPLAGGTNNYTWSVRAGDVSLYVLRLISGTVDLPRLRYENALLAELQSKSLPFVLPRPLLAADGESFVLIEQDGMDPAIAVLTPFLPGRIPERNAANLTLAGVALAQLDIALASIEATSLPASSQEANFQYGDLFHCHPLIPDPLAIAEQLLPPEQARPLCAIFAQCLQDWETLSAQNFPQQLIHRDYGPGNVLAEQGRVSAVLDFEFAGMDRRLFDLCVALSWWPVRLMGTGREWELIDALGQAYTALFPLTEQELLALPAALRMRDNTALVYRMGRYLAGLETMQTVQERVQHACWRETWLLTNHERVLEHAMAWRSSN